MARSRELVGVTRLPGGQELTLTKAQGHFALTLDGVPLMTSAAHHSEEHLADVGCAGLATRPRTRILVGGLGMGYTLRAALDRTSATSEVVVAELVPAVVEWNRGPLAELAGRPLEDPRTRLEVRDICEFLASEPAPFDAILLDTDNGPDDFTAKGNARLYDPGGLARMHALLRPGGRLVVWSAYQCPAFVRSLRRARFEATVVKSRARGDKGGRHTLYVGRRPESEPPTRAKSATAPPSQRAPTGRRSRRKRRGR